MATKYISTTGNDTTGDGSLGNPWATLDKAYAACASGDTVYLIGHATNTFAGFSGTGGLSIEKALSFIGYNVLSGSPRPVISGLTNGIIMNTNGTLSLTDIDFTSVTLKSFYGFATMHLYSAPGARLRFTRLRLHDIIGHDVAWWAGILGCAGLSTGTSWSDPVIRWDNCSITGTMDRSGGSTGAALYRFDSGAAYFLDMVNCVIHSPLDGVSGVNMLFYEQSAGGMARLRNCVIQRTGSGTIEFENVLAPGMNGAACSNNLFTGGFTYAYQPSGAAGVGLVSSADPLFWDTVNRDFRPRPNSPLYELGIIP